MKKASFPSIPLCIRRNDGSEEEDQLINLKEQKKSNDSTNNSLRNRSHSLNNTKNNFNNQLKTSSFADSIEKGI